MVKYLFDVVQYLTTAVCGNFAKIRVAKKGTKQMKILGNNSMALSAIWIKTCKSEFFKDHQNSTRPKDECCLRGLWENWRVPTVKFPSIFKTNVHSSQHKWPLKNYIAFRHVECFFFSWYPYISVQYYKTNVVNALYCTISNVIALLLANLHQECFSSILLHEKSLICLGQKVYPGHRVPLL